MQRAIVQSCVPSRCAQDRTRARWWRGFTELVIFLGLCAPNGAVAQETAIPSEAAPATRAVADVSEDDAIPAPAAPWYSDLAITAFADAFFAGHWTLPNPLQGDRTDILYNRAYDAAGGLNLSFAGLDVSYDDGTIGAAISLRFGPSGPRLQGSVSGIPKGMQFLTQAYVSWRPIEQLQIDFGEFNTIYGSEVAESWLNPTYTRGSLYMIAQPFYHTGFRVAWSPAEEVTLTVLAVNGWNNVVDDNDGKTVGAQLSWSSGPLSFAVGYLTGPEGAGNNELFRHLVDALATLELGDVTLYANADFVTEDSGGGVYQSMGGGMLAAHVALGEYFGLGLRGEYVHEGAIGQGLGTGTLTLEAIPTELLVIRLDTRVDIATDDRFIDPDSQPSPLVVSSVLGVSFHTN